MPKESQGKASAAYPAAFEWTLVGCCLVIGAWLRVRDLGKRPLWLDEFITLLTVRRSLKDSFLQMLDASAPLYQLVLRTLTDGVAPSPTLLRLPALLFGCAVIPAGWWLARLLSGRWVALALALLLAINWKMVRYSCEARGYSLFVLMSIVSMTCFYRMVMSKSRGRMAAYLLATTILVYSHYYGFLCVAAQVAYVIGDMFCRGSSRREALQMIGVYAVLLLLSLPALWLIAHFFRQGAQVLVQWVWPTGFAGGIEILGQMLGHRMLGGLLLIPLISVVWPSRTPYDPGPSAPANCGVRAWWSRRGPFLLCFTWILFSFFFLVVVGILWRPLVHTRYVLPVLIPLACLGLSYALAVSRTLLVGILLVLLGINIFLLQQSEESRAMPDLVAYLHEHASNADHIFVPDVDEHLHTNPKVGQVNLEKMSLEYYSFRDAQRVRALYRDKSHSAIADIPRQGCTYIVCYWSQMREVKPRLEAQGLSFQMVHFGAADQDEVFLVVVTPKQPKGR